MVDKPFFSFTPGEHIYMINSMSKILWCWWSNQFWASALQYDLWKKWRVFQGNRRKESLNWTIGLPAHDTQPLYFFRFLFPIGSFERGVHHWLIFTLSSWSQTLRWDTVYVMSFSVSKHARKMGARDGGSGRVWWRANLIDVQWTSNEWLSWLVSRARYWWETISFFSQGNITSKGFWNLVDKWKNRSKQMAWQNPETQMEITMTSCALVSLVSRDMVINEWDMSDHDWAVVKQVSLNTRKNISCRCIASEIHHIFFCQGSHIMNLIYNSVRPE